MALKTSDIDVEIASIQKKMTTGEKAIVSTIKKLDKQKQNQQKLVDKHKRLQSAKININQYNRAG